MPVLKQSEIEQVVLALLAGAGVPRDQSRLQCDLLVDAEMRGLPSHGLLRLPRIIERIANGVTDPNARGDCDWVSPAFLRVDGKRGLGPVVALNALDAAMPRAREMGTAVVSIANSNHIGSLGFYAECVANAGQSVIAFSTSEALVHPWGGRRALIGTNPIAIGVPGAPEPFVMDTATSVVSMGKIHDHAARGEAIPAGWALDADGVVTEDAERAKQGAIAPVGGAKGYALGLAFELLVSGLAGASIGRDVKGTLDSTEVANKADLFILIDQPLAAFDAYLDELRNSPPADGFSGVRIPGERGRALRAERRQGGVPVDEGLWAQLLRLQQEVV
ncbi:Ldh family oxidoreductase [Devosia pacifica]|uniref:Ldh family oxidoreductase n=1 Tax=Devosia pacifica TaxID=1335967 RepID=UPI001FCE3FB4|nr:Ldh family oxidoreductase [Devosia pacifica]